MKRLIALVCSLLATIGLPACDYFALRDLEPGVSTAADVRDRLGRPGMEWQNDDGSVTWEYSRQPEGTQCYMVTIGPDGVLRSIDQVLNESGFSRIERGMTGNEVRRILGRPASEAGRLCHDDGGHAGGARRRRAVMLPILILSARAGRRSALPSAERQSIAIVLPSM